MTKFFNGDGVTERQRGSLFGYHVQTDQGTTFSVAAAQGLNSTAFVRAKSSFSGPILLRDIPYAGCLSCANPQHPTDPESPMPSQQSTTHIFCKIFAPNQVGRHPRRQRPKQETCLTQTHDLRTQTSTFTNAFQTLQCLRQCCHQTFKVFFTTGFEVFLECLSDGSWGIKFIVSVPCRCQFPEVFVCRQAFQSSRPGAVLSLLSFDSLVNGLAKCVPVLIDLRRSPSLERNIRVVSMKKSSY